MEAKLAFIPDGHYGYVLDQDEPAPVSGLLNKTMLSLDLKAEAARMFAIGLQ
ncbi:hypothetical protein [Paenibacillus solani]|uniref:hypothetical protein n=1 Tax=Paenibacillus solani TaxID=1705565 RepID=UPI000B1B2218|nr:hypothetical protein [Paenibacillus solani]